MSSRTLTVNPSGVIKGGKLTYEASKSGAVSIDGWIEYKVLFSRKTLPLKNSTKVNPDYLLSKNVKAGVLLRIDKLLIKVLSVRGLKAVCALELVGDIKATGSAVLDLKEELVLIDELRASGKKLGMTINIEAVHG